MKTKIYLSIFIFILTVEGQAQLWWLPVGSGVNGRVTSFTKFNNELVAAGSFTEAGGAPADKVATWNGSNWSNLGVTGVMVEITSVEVNNNELFASVPFPANPIIKWDGTNWYSISSSLSTPVYSLAEYNSQLTGGIIYNFNGYEVASWDGNSWNILGPGGEFINGSLRSILVVNNDLYIAGNFESIPLNTTGIMKWDGNNWSAVGSGMDNIWTLAEYNGEIYAGGDFTTVSGAPANYIARWDGNTWSAVGAGVNNSVRALKVINNELYAGGTFSTAGGNTADAVAKWNGTTWTAVGAGVNGSVLAIEEYNNEIFIGGDFAVPGPGPVFFSHIARMSAGVGINEISADINIEVTPNPSTGEIKITTSDIPDEIIVYDIAGRKHFQQNSFKDKINEVEIINPGLYLLTVKTPKGVRTEKAIVIQAEK